ncbi:MAG: hypothetical protein DLM69_00290 [Candidatus Chloroheliales bacterium]|nr:MAG: hypothetical protein DLM69_00290 [Chloroflexota bacterium]
MESSWRKFLRFLWAFVIIAGLIFGLLLTVILKLLSIEPNTLWVLFVSAISALCGGILANLHPVVDFFNRPFMPRQSPVSQPLSITASQKERAGTNMTSTQGSDLDFGEALHRRITRRLMLEDLRTWCFYMEEQEPKLSYSELEGGLSDKLSQLIRRAVGLNKRSLLINKLYIVRSDILRDDLAQWKSWAERLDAGSHY